MGEADAAERLAIRGGAPIRTRPMPPRLAMGEAETKMVSTVLEFYRARAVDPGYQGHFEKLYTDAFVDLHGGGHADAVATGTSALYVAIAALDLAPGSQVLVSPITDPGTLSAIILNRLVPRLVDSKSGSYNTGLAEITARVTPETRALVLVHSIGQAVADTVQIVEAMHAQGIKVVEDCSQSHGARADGGQLVGTMGDIAAFSTMYRKAHISGGAGGMVYCRDLALFRNALAHADRGKPRWLDSFDDRDPSGYLFPALNHHTDEISCGIGFASLGRLANTILARLAFVAETTAGIAETCEICRPYGYSPGDSPFVLPVVVDVSSISVSKRDFALAVKAEGIDLNPHYGYAAFDWPWLRPYLADDFSTPQARDIRDRSFVLYLNENYTDAEAADAVAAMAKVERHLSRC